MLEIGGAWQRIDEETGRTSISIKLSDEFLELHPEFKNLNFTLYESKVKTEDKHPDFFCFLRKKLKQD